MSHRRDYRGSSRGTQNHWMQRPPPRMQTGLNQYAGYNQHPQMPPPPPQYGQATMPPPNMYSNQQANQPTQYMYVPVPMPQQQQPPPPMPPPMPPHMPPQYIPPLMSQPMYQPTNHGSTSGNCHWNSHNGVQPTEYETRDIKQSSYVPQRQRKSTQKIKDNRDKNKVDPKRDDDGSRQIKTTKDVRFEKLKSLLADEPTEPYQNKTGSQDNAIEREHRQRSNRGDQRDKGQNTQEDDVEHSGSSEDSKTDSNNSDCESQSDFRDQQSTKYDRRSQRNLSDITSHGVNKRFVKSSESVNNIGYRGPNQSKGGNHGNYRGDQRQNENTNSDQSFNIFDSYRGKQRSRGKGQHRGRGGYQSMSNHLNEPNAEEDDTLCQQKRGAIGRGREGGMEKRSGDRLLENDQTDNSDGHKNYQTNKSLNRVERRDRSQGRRKDKYDKLKSEMDDTDDNESEIPDVDDIEVFKFLIKNFKGGCAFEDLLKSCHLFPYNSNVCLWFKKHSRRFHVFWDGKAIVYIQPFFRDANICAIWNNKKNPGQCENTACHFFHVCRRFIRGNCKESNCSLSHSFKSRHNRHLKNKLGISDFSEADIKIVLNCKSPSLCVDYIYNNGCKIQNSDKRCPYLHLCQNKIFRKCEDPCKFQKTHSITQFHNKWVLESFHMKGWEEERVLKTIYVPPRQRKESEKYSDDSDPNQVEDVIDDNNTYNDDSDVNVSTESLSSTASDPVKAPQKVITDTQSKESIMENEKPNSGRRERFETTENIICGIVGKDDLDLTNRSTSKIQYNDGDEDDNIKERERIMMQMWEEKEQGISSFDNNKRVKPKPASRNPSDPDYQETNPSLLKDETDKLKICLFVSKDKCPSQSCKNHHLPSGLPYLWQLKISEKWKTGKRYSYHIWFAKMHAVTLNVDDQSVSGDNQWSNVRRLSTHSFAERKASVDSYITQWRWYLKDDSDKWTMFDKDVFLFTLEKKYQTKQKTYLYTKENENFMYRIDFLKMTQVNLETDDIRQIIRRPLFVSKDDILQNQFPKSIPFPVAMSTVKPASFYNWDCAHDFELVELETTGKEYREVLTSLTDTMDPDRFEFKFIYRIQNRKLWSEYDIKKNHMLADADQIGNGKTIDERNLFHGTDSLNTCRGICTNNFDFRTSGRNATVYGEGSYFAVHARTGNSYTQADLPTDIRFMFRAKILVGQFTVGNPSLRRPPEIPGQVHKLYDSCVDDVQDPKIFVVFDRNQCYPDYLIMYTDRETKPPVEKSDSNPNNTENPVDGLDPLVHCKQVGSSTSTTIQRSLQSPPHFAESSPVDAIARFVEGRKRKDDNCVLQ
ncbi:PARP7S [Mytilus edulis]|uniref:PARP7S n=1 Tax=Mytilus edulis TaxID=6550 RepID=A0A8S3UP48_MYTED|nr:PARP7S [Mytilus edulis]